MTRLNFNELLYDNNLGFVFTEDTDQPGHPYSLVKDFTVHVHEDSLSPLSAPERL